MLRLYIIQIYCLASGNKLPWPIYRDQFVLSRRPRDLSVSSPEFEDVRSGSEGEKKLLDLSPVARRRKEEKKEKPPFRSLLCSLQKRISSPFLLLFDFRGNAQKLFSWESSTVFFSPGKLKYGENLSSLPFGTTLLFAARSPLRPFAQRDGTNLFDPLP